MAVVRSVGTTGTVGCSITATPISASSADYNVEMEPLEFLEGENTTMFMITIINDDIPELEEVRTCHHFDNNILTKTWAYVICVSCCLCIRHLKYPSPVPLEVLVLVIGTHSLSPY